MPHVHFSGLHKQTSLLNNTAPLTDLMFCSLSSFISSLSLSLSFPSPLSPFLPFSLPSSVSLFSPSPPPPNKTRRSPKQIAFQCHFMLNVHFNDHSPQTLKWCFDDIGSTSKCLRVWSHENVSYKCSPIHVLP